MDTITFQNKLTEYITQHSGLELKRDYLGISKIADCPRRAALEYRNGITPTEESHRNSFMGYEQEARVLQIVGAVGMLRRVNVEVVAPFDNRLRGHLDGDVSDTDLIEIKSVSLSKFQKIRESKRALTRHYIQVQLYMQYGGYKRAWIIYRCRETYEHEVICVEHSHNSAMKYEGKARRILAAIDSDEIPACECGYCKD